MRFTINDKYDILDDIQRIENKCATLQTELNNLLGISLSLTIKTNWNRNDIPTINNMERIRSNLQTLINLVTVYNIDTFGNKFMYTNANQFEEAIEKIEYFITHQAIEDRAMAGYYIAGEPLKLMAERS